MNKLLKLKNNLLSLRAFSVLGKTLYLQYLINAFLCISEIVTYRDFRRLDKAMGASAKLFHYRGSPFIFDCHFCDQHMHDDSFGFGIVREIYIRDCYFKWHPTFVYKNARVVIDLGANRGAFSTLMTTRSDFILSVECEKQYHQIIRHNFDSNNFSNYSIETAFIGNNKQLDLNIPVLTIDDLFNRNNINSADLVKIDIEGSEFSLFSSTDWLHRVNAISMEVHPNYGDPDVILKTMRKHGFSYIIADENLLRVSESGQAHFIYAWKTKGLFTDKP